MSKRNEVNGKTRKAEIENQTYQVSLQRKSLPNWNSLNRLAKSHKDSDGVLQTKYSLIIVLITFLRSTQNIVDFDKSNIYFDQCITEGLLFWKPTSNKSKCGKDVKYTNINKLN